MKVFLVALLFAGVCYCEPPRFRSGRLQSRFLSRQEAAPPAVEDAPAAAPYPASGWKPDGETLELPTETEAPAPAPAGEYGPPITEYGPPAGEYGPPAASGDQDAAVPAEEPEAETVAPISTNGRLRSAYVLLVPPEALQRIQIAPQRRPAKLRQQRF